MGCHARALTPEGKWEASVFPLFAGHTIASMAWSWRWLCCRARSPRCSGHDSLCSIISVTRAASALPAPQQVQLWWLQSSSSSPHKWANRQGMLAVLIPLLLDSQRVMVLCRSLWIPSPAAQLPWKGSLPLAGLSCSTESEAAAPSPWQHGRRAVPAHHAPAPLGCPGGSSEPRVSRISPRNVKGQRRE